MMKNVFVMVVLVLSVSLVSADVIFSYGANADPTTVGWTEAGNGTFPIVAGGVETDGTKYWEVNDASAAGRMSYKSDVAPSYGQTRGSAIGWTYTAKLKVVGATGASVVRFGLADGWRVWDVHVTDSGVYAGATLVKAMDTTDGYHTYQMVCDPSDTNKIAIYVDGVESLSNYSVGLVYAGYSASFGSGATGGTGTGRYNEVTFETGVNVVPEPATMMLFGAGACAGLLKKR